MIEIDNKKKQTSAALKPLMERIQLLIQESGGQTAFAKKVGISRNTIHFWSCGERAPSAEALLQIAQECGCSLDWLFGLVREDNVSTDSVRKEMSGYTGLSTKAIETLHDALTVTRNGEFRLFTDRSELADLLNLLIESPEYIRLFDLVSEYLSHEKNGPFEALKEMIEERGRYDVAAILADYEALRLQKLLNEITSLLGKIREAQKPNENDLHLPLAGK